MEETKGLLIADELTEKILESAIDRLGEAFENLEVISSEEELVEIVSYGLTGQREFIIFTIVGGLILTCLGVLKYFEVDLFVK